MGAASTTEFVYRLIPAAEWEAAGKTGLVSPSADDRRDGFMHLSTRAQMLETARRYFAGRTDMLALEIRASALGDLRFEQSRNGELFPHLYGDLSTQAVVRTLPLEASGGAFVIASGAQ